ncbi:MAG: response regulator [Candidatus Poribacteria bacterium]
MGKKRILFIEDDNFTLEQLQIALEDYDYEIVPASSAVKGMDLVNRMNFDAVLLDIMMPPPEDIDPELVGNGRTTGVEICRRIRHLKPDLPIVVLSVVRDPGILRRIEEAGADEIINKPALSSKINEALDSVLHEDLSN